MYPRAPYAIYALSLAVSISLWFIALRAPLWLDETVSYFQIKGGFSEIMVRAGWPSVPAYSYILWLWTKLMGTGEIALRILSILAMLVAVLLLFCAARDLFYRSGDKDAAAIGAVIFCLNPLVIFAAIDVRPYAFGALAINASIFLLVRLRHNNSNWLPALLGFSAASIVYFHFLFQVILPALAISFIAVKSKTEDRQTLLRRGGIALAAFSVAYLPLIPGLRYMLNTRSEHVFAEAPTLAELGSTLAPELLLFILCAALLVDAAARQPAKQKGLDRGGVLLCASLAFVPILILYGVSVDPHFCSSLPAGRDSRSRALLGYSRQSD
jgi:hypothetical protein